MTRGFFLLALVALAACAAPDTRPPAADGERVRAEAQVQQRMAFGARSLHPASRKRETNSLVDDDLADLKRVADVGWRVLAGAAPACCEATEGQSGALFATIHDIPEPLRALYFARYQFQDEALVVAVAADSPAERAGLAVGDRIEAVDGRAVPQSARTGRTVEDMLAGRAGSPVTLTVRRDGQASAVTLVPAPACRSRLKMARAGAVNAFADGHEVVVLSGMVRFLEDDDHLATVIGHEIAHNIRGHLSKQAENEQTGAAIGSVLDLLTGARELKDHWAGVGGRAFSQGFETEADYVGLYLTAQAGFDIAKAPSLWRRMAVANPITIGHASTHPTTPSRFVTLEAAVKEIEAKREAGLPLRPEKRKGLF